MFDKETAILILNYNGREFLEKFLPSVIKHSIGADIVVIDNASTDDSISYLEKNHSTFIEIITLDQNKGFAAGYNEGIKLLKHTYKYFALLNSDIEIKNDWLSPITSFMNTTEDAVACQPKILSQTNTENFEYAGAAGGFMDKYYFPFCRGRIFSSVEKDVGQYDHAIEVHWVSGAAMVIRSNVFIEAEGFDDDFFAHMEEIDLCIRLRSLGHTMHCIPESLVYHVGGGTLNYDSPRKTYLNYRNNLSLIIKNHDGWLLPLLFFRMTLDGISAMLFLLKLRPNHFLQVGWAHAYMYMHFKQTYLKRKKLKMKRKNANHLYRGSIVFDYFIRQIRHFSKLNSRRFIL